MMHHISFNARHPEKAAIALTEMFAAERFRAPSPPFPNDSWLICMGDDQGTLIELMPWGVVRDPSDLTGLSNDCDMRSYSGSHVLLTSPRSSSAILGIAARAEWQAEPGSAGMFKFTKVWVENTFLIEIMTHAQSEQYKETFNRVGLTNLNSRLRQIEVRLRHRVLPPQPDTASV